MLLRETENRTRWGTKILPDGTLDYSFKGSVRLNRSQRWEHAETYQEARDKSPSTRPVR